MSRPRLVVFDVDGTLVDSQNHICAAMDEAFGAIGRSTPPRHEVLSIVGLSLPLAMARLLPGVKEHLTATAIEAYKAAFGRLRADGLSPLFPGARAALDALAERDDILMGIATGKSRRGLDHIIEAHGLAGYFATRQVADDHPSKPHPSMLLAALDEAGVAAADAAMLGDTTYDVEMAHAAGVTAIGVGWGYHAPDALKQVGAVRILSDFAELSSVLDGHWGRP